MSADLQGALDEVRGWLQRFVVFSDDHGPTAVALWIAFTHAVKAFDVAPYLLVTAPEIESGKTRLLEIAAPLSHKPVFSSSMTPAVLFRTLDKEHPTLFLDEADNTWTGKGDEAAQELTKLLNAGHRRGMPARRMGGPGKTRLDEFDVFGPKAIAGAFPDVGNIPEALRSRSVHLRMKRKLPGETVDRWTRATREEAADYVADLRSRLAAAVVDAEPETVKIDPLDELTDRDFDVWEPLLAIAHRAGGSWPADAFDASIALCAKDATQAIPLRILMLRDLRELWDGEAHLLTSTILERLHSMEDRPWGDFYGSPITPHRLGRMLGGYGVESKFEPGPDRRKGYYRQDLEDLWARYAPETDDPSLRAGRSSQTSQTSLLDPGEVAR